MDYLAQGYAVYARPVQRYVKDGSTKAATLLFNIGVTTLGVLTGFGLFGSFGRKVNGTQYKVKK